MKKIAWVLPIIFVLVIIALACTLQPDQGDDTDHSSNDVSEESGIATEEWSEGDDRTRFDAFFADHTKEDYFRVLDVNNYTGKNELVNKDGEIVELCFCSKVPCNCGLNERMLVFGSTACAIGMFDQSGIIFNIFDLSDIADIKHNTLRVDGINMTEYSIHYKTDSPFYYFEKKGDSGCLIVLDMSESASGRVDRVDYLAYKGGNYIPLMVYEGKLYSVSHPKAGAYTTLYSAKPGDTKPKKILDIPSSIGRFYICPGLGESMYFFNLEYDNESQNGMSLWQYVILETYDGVKTKRIWRERNICDCVFAGKYYYFTVNDPALNKEFPDQDKGEGKLTYQDMTGGKIFRGEILGSAAEEIACLDNYYFYGFNSKNKPIRNNMGSNSISFQHIFRQSSNNGVALSVNKEIDGRYIHTQLLITLIDNDVRITELEGSAAWGIVLIDDALNGGTSCNWNNRP